MTAPLTPERLEAIAKRAAAATEGPWYLSEYGNIFAADGATMVAGQYDDEQGGFIRTEDAEFSAHARQDVPDLLAEVAWLKAENAALEATLFLARAALDTARSALELVSGSEAQPMAAAEVRAALADIRAATGR